MKKHLFVILLCIASLSAAAQDWKVLFSANGGFYEDVFELELFSTYPQGRIFYTINGNRPTTQSRLYTEPLVLDASLYSQTDIYTIVNCPIQDFFLPDSVQHCIVIRAAVFDENDSCISSVNTNSYFIRALGCDTHGLPAVSLCADSLDLFDYERGIFVPGIWFDPLDPAWTGNYYLEGRDWERPLNVEFYELDNTGINQQAGLRTHGGNGRRFQQKCVKIYAREEYGKKRFEHKFFETIPQNSFKHLVFKPFAASWNDSGVNDHICNQIVSHLNVESLASRPVTLFLNGEYWGIYYVHERPDERYLEDHFGVDIEHVNLISGWNPFVSCGTYDNFLEFFHWMEAANLSDPEAYNEVKTKIDIDNFIDYQIFELFAENTDWPVNNMRCWQLDDGKWRWIFFDGDACLYWITFAAFENAVCVCDEGELWPANWQSTLFFRRLLENEEFKDQLNSRFHELLGTTFDYSTTGPIFESIKTAIIDEVPFQSQRFGFPTSVDSWNEAMGITNWFLMKRSESIEEHLHELLFDIADIQKDGLACYPNPTSGELHLRFQSEASGDNEIAIYDMMGRKVFSQSYHLQGETIEATINPPLASGVYVMKVNGYAKRIVRH